MTGERLNRLRNWPRVVVRVDEVPVGVATDTRTPVETHVPIWRSTFRPPSNTNMASSAPHVIDSLST